MGIKIRPVNSGDIKETYGEVKHLINTNSVYEQLSVESTTIFGSKSKKSDYEDTSIYNRRGYIHFPIPVLNFFLAGDNANILNKLLGKKVSQIAEGRIVFDKATGKEIYAEKLDKSLIYNEEILIGGNYIKYLIDILDIERCIENYLGSIIYDMFPRSFKKNNACFDKIGNISKITGKIWIIDDYYFNPLIELDEDMIEESLPYLRKDMVSEHTSTLVLLLSIRGQKEKVRDQIMDNMIVMPIGYRPSIDKKKDPLTKAYNRVVKCNNDLKNALKYSNVTIESVRIRYKELITEVKNVTVENRNRYNEQFTPIADLLKGKTGHIRECMQGTRSDYTGRSVIVVDPFMSIDTIGIPRVMAEKLMELNVIQNYKTKSNNKSGIFIPGMKALRQAEAAKILEGKYAIIGRQPTLYYLGIKAFKVKIVEGNSIILNPLSTPSFNADFDGDQMYCSIPITKEAQEEVDKLLASTNNLFLPRSGECHISPRQEIIYGLWRASNEKTNNKSNLYFYEDTHMAYVDILEKVCSQEINIYDVVEIEGKISTAGIIAIKACLGVTYSKYKLGVLPLTIDSSEKDKAVSEGWFKELMKIIALDDKRKFISVTNKLVKLGFSIANIFPPNISVLNYPDVSNLIDEFDERIREREELYNMGFETEMSFTSFYDKEYSKLESDIKSALKKGLGSGNGYMDMVESGARGSMSNVLQLFGMKGRVMKNEDEAFNAIIRHPLSAQLTGLEHFITAYGARQGLVDKTIKTYEPGYLSRKMSHTSSPMYITTSDCGTQEGILLDYDFVKQFIPEHLFSKDDIYNNKLVRDYVIKLLIGRYIVGFEHEIITSEDAEEIYNTMIASVDKGNIVKKQGVKLRSVITCLNPCCVKCYGRDLGSNKSAVIGLPIGYIAAQSIGEPGTQLTMKNFQSGGVAGVTNLTSSFDKMSDYLHVYDLKNKSRNDKAIGYDYIAPVEGFIETISRGDGYKELKIKNYNSKGILVNKLKQTVILYDEVQLKDYVKVGDSIQLIQGDLNIREILNYRTPEYAQKYLVMMLFNIFQQEVFVSLKHFEVLVASMTFYICLKGNKQFKTGNYYTIQEYYRYDRSECEFAKTIKGIGEVATYRTDVLSTIFMENIVKGITRSIITSGYDTLTNPLIRTSFGLDLGIGSDVTGYIEGRDNF